MSLDRETIEEHESFGLINVHRLHGGNDVLFGSSIRHHNTICLEIKEASKRRHLNRDWYYGKDSLIRVEMSKSQFTDMITSMNQGDGVPCTLKMVGGKRREECPAVNERLKFETEFKEKIDSIVVDAEKLVRDSVEILSGSKPPKKAEKEQLISQMQMLLQEIRSNVPFVQSQFNEAMDKVVNEAKGEIDAHVDQKLHGLGIEGLKSQQLLEDHTGEECQSTAKES